MNALIPIELADFPAILVIEVYVLCIAAVAALLAPAKWNEPFSRIEAALSALARRPVFSLVIAGMAPILLRLALSSHLPFPAPGIHDEYSYLLAGDTFRHGRLANPPHPLWAFFESIHILQHPTYASMYPPAQGTFLAFGQLLTGVPWTGVLISMGLFCAALLWMLRGWVGAEWALLGAALAIVRFGVFSYWTNSYWGGAPAAIGGALVAGSVPRLIRRGCARHAALLSAGLVLLAASRPYEGFLFSIPFVVVCLAALVRGARPPRQRLQVVLAASGVLIAGAATLAYYNWRVTGDALKLPERLNKEQYGIVPDLLFEKMRAPHQYLNEDMRTFYEVLEPQHYGPGVHSFGEFIQQASNKLVAFYDFFLGPALLLPLLLAGAVCLRPGARVLSLAIALVFGGVALERWQFAQPHYFSPAACAVIAVVLLAMRQIWSWKLRNRPVGRFLVRGIVVTVIIMAAIRLTARRLDLDLTEWPLTWAVSPAGNYDRAAMLATLDRMPGRFLVIVRYASEHNPVDEWVYNDADIDNAKVIWARDFGASNSRLLTYYRDRRVLLVEPDRDRKNFFPYPAQPLSSLRGNVVKADGLTDGLDRAETLQP